MVNTAYDTICHRWLGFTHYPQKEAFIPLVIIDNDEEYFSASAGYSASAEESGEEARKRKLTKPQHITAKPTPPEDELSHDSSDSNEDTSVPTGHCSHPTSPTPQLLMEQLPHPNFRPCLRHFMKNESGSDTDCVSSHY